MQQARRYNESNLEMGTLDRVTPGALTLDDFLNEAQHIENCINNINENVRAIEDLHIRSMDLVSHEESTRNSQALDETINDTRVKLVDAKNRIRAMEANNMRLGATANAQIRVNKHFALKTKFLDALRNYQNIEGMYRERYRQMIERQIRIVNPDATQEEIDDALNSNQPVFAQAIVSSSRSAEARNVYQAVQDRHEDIVKIDKTITELANLFQEMQLLVETQDEVVREIDTQMSEVVIHTTQANKELDVAKDHAASARKKKWCLFVFLLILIVVIILIIYFTVIKK
ncbi:syntaxin-like protein psy1 [Basidiobolus meristosporus CBS 931.73]|uniref:Syntaxin-like protein psy1 n=1 Tax=Basidiobolus meristosporus CBS 931.73 TaxID=1314790 RepID=A0A1Y1Z975_9FUNG|nr:syntaxin-like protein psy1 [Basidiobolus meristosporus CBS 931.73]|eukprot:ORY06832.1 syntaxin-like protein psy1 [Basidiobolus meristosporus CBS 931.73]